ncbi:MAG: FRG domain-containing protein [Nitrospirae bacterium]|nr:FRG domain-containing protein [Nitrospirota bacterium]
MLQHYGFPTPLLDWTYSPYIAAYFAYRDVNDLKPESKYVKIYIFDYIQWSVAYTQYPDIKQQTNTTHISIIRPYAMFNERIIPQKSVLTLSTVDDMESHISLLATSSKKDFLYTVLLPVSEKPVVMRELHLMGIDEMTLFPSIDGICRAQKNLFFSQPIVQYT